MDARTIFAGFIIAGMRLFWDHRVMKTPDEICGWTMEANDGGMRSAEITVRSIEEALTWIRNCMQAGMTKIRVVQEDRALAEARQKKEGNDFGYVIIGEPGHREIIEKLRRQS